MSLANDEKYLAARFLEDIKDDKDRSLSFKRDTAKLAEYLFT